LRAVVASTVSKLTVRRRLSICAVLHVQKRRSFSNSSCGRSFNRRSTG
jgi:hypothetical protein